MKGIYSRLIAILIAMTFSTGLSVAQITVGVRGGANLSRLSNSQYKSTPGLHAGTFVEIPFKQSFSLQPELTFTQKGAATGLDQPNAHYNSFTKGAYRREALSLDYFDLAALGRFNYKNGFYFLLGPQFSLLMHGRFKYTNGGKEPDFYSFPDNKSYVDAGLVAGVGYEAKNGWFVGLRGEYGFVPVLHDTKMRNSLIQLTTGIRIFTSGQDADADIEMEEDTLGFEDESVNE